MTASAPQSRAIQNDFERLQAGEITELRNFSTDTLELFVADEDMDFMTRNRAQTELTIRKSGIALIAVMADDSLSEEEMLETTNGDGYQNRKPAFVYSVGMDRLGLPEMLTFYPNPRDCHYVLNTIHKQLLDHFDRVPTADNYLTVFDPFDNEELPVFATLLTKEEREWAYEEYTCQVESEDTPVMLIHIPTPNGDSTFGFIPEELHGFAERLRPQS